MHVLTSPYWPSDAEVLLPVEPPKAEAPGQLPAHDRVQLGTVELGPGRLATSRRARVGASSAALWITDDAVPGAIACWAALAEQFPTTGLWPLLLRGLDADPRRPGGSAELMPTTEADVDALDVHEVLESGWRDRLLPIDHPWPPGAGPFAPFGSDFPGLAAPQPARAPVPMLFEDGPARIGVVPCRRGADAVALAGWTGAINVTGAAEISAVLRSWEDRFGAFLVGLSFATMTLVVTRPPTSDGDALRVAAEVAALCPDAVWQPESTWPDEQREPTLEAVSRQLVREHVWRLWFD